MARKISFLSYKGGVGKTSLAVNTGACLAQKGARVLLVDLDTQANASIWLLGLERWNRLNTKKGATLYSVFNPGNTTLSDCVWHDVVRGRDAQPLLSGMDLVPTGFDLVDLESDLEGGNLERPACVIFQEQLERLEQDYDYMLFDCPPHTLRAAQCAIFSSNEIYVPANADSLSLIGLTLLEEKLHKFRKASAAYRKSGMGEPAEIRGIIFNSVRDDCDLEVAEAEASMPARLNQFRNSKQASPGARILKTKIRYNRNIERAVVVGLPVSLLGIRDRETDDVRSDYRNLAAEIADWKSIGLAAGVHLNAAGF